MQRVKLSPAIVIHPSLRLKWLTSEDGESNRDGYRALFEHVYNDYASSGQAQDQPAVSKPSQELSGVDFLKEVCAIPMAADGDGLQLSEGESSASGSAAKDEVERYLSGEGSPSSFHEPLQWWKVRFFDLRSPDIPDKMDLWLERPQLIPHHCADGPGLFSYSSDQCCR